MADERLVVLNRSDNYLGFGFSLLGEAGLPHIIYDIEENSPAAQSGEVEAGDVLLKVNGTDVNRFTTKEVLKCLRLSSDPVTLRLKKDPQIKASVRRYLNARHNDRSPLSSNSNSNSSCNTNSNSTSSNGSRVLSGDSCEALLSEDRGRVRAHQPKFEAYMMTGDLILNLSRAENSHHNHHAPTHRTHFHRFNSQPASPGCLEQSRVPHTVRTSRSEDHLQKGSSLSAVAVELEEDVTSSLNTLLDARPDSATPTPKNSDAEKDRIVWTYNAPVSSTAERGERSASSSSDVASQRSSSPSPTSMSSAALSSRAAPRPINGDMSLSEAVSNISSPDYQDQDIFESSQNGPRMELSDASDSDSTILVSEPCHKRAKSVYSNGGSDVTLNGDGSDYRIVIQVKAAEKNGDVACNGRENGCESPENRVYSDGGQEEAGSESGSDGDSLHSFHYSPKAVDLPSAERLAKRLYHLDGFKKSDVSRHLSKNNEFSRAVAEEYVRHFDFSNLELDGALRLFLSRFALTGETQQRERVLVHFSRRYLECNPDSFNSQDAVHTLTCAIMLLNTDLHSGGGGGGFRHMSCADFIDNLADLNDGQDFPHKTLKHLYHNIRSKPLTWAVDESSEEAPPASPGGTVSAAAAAAGGNPFLSAPNSTHDYKKGYVMRKCCHDANGKKTSFGRRGWKMFYCTLRELVLYLHKDEHGFRREQISDNLHNAIRIHHALATKATDYTKKQHVFRLRTADQAEYLFQTSDAKELVSWVESINLVCAAWSGAPLPAAVGSQRKFQRPLLPCSRTKLHLPEQLASHERLAAAAEKELASLKRTNSAHVHDKEAYLMYEIKRYRTYIAVLKSRSGTTVLGEPEAA